MEQHAHSDAMRAWLNTENMSQAELARRLDFEPNYVYMVVRGDRGLSPGFRLKFQKAFGFDPADQFGSNGHDA